MSKNRTEYKPHEKLQDLSNTEVSNNGLFDWLNYSDKPFIGVRCSLIIGSDAYLDALVDKTIQNYIEFYE